MQLENKEYYTYIWLDPRKPGNYKYNEEFEFACEPFYVGKGNNGRYREFGKRNFYCFNKVAKIRRETGNDPIILKVIDGLSEIEAHDLEKELIGLIGRKDLGKGVLLNLTDGGEGASGQIQSEETRRKRRERIISEETRLKSSVSKRGEKNPNFGKVMSEEVRKKISNATKGENNSFYGQVHSDETRKKMSNSWNYDLHVNEEIKRKISEGNRGKIVSEETRQKLRIANKDQRTSLGMKRSEETKRRMSESAKRRGASFPIEVIRAAAEARRGTHRSEETKKKISETMKRVKGEQKYREQYLKEGLK